MKMADIIRPDKGEEGPALPVIEVQPVEEPDRAPSGGRRRLPAAATAVICCAAVCAAAVLGGLAVDAAISKPAAQPSAQAQQASQDDKAAKAAESWQARYVLVHHEAQTHLVEHPAEYGTVTESHTLCNVCKEEIDGKVAEHAEKTGHSGWTNNVPVKKTVKLKDAWTETVTDRAAYDELVEDGQKSDSGQVRGNRLNDDGTPVSGA